MSSYRIVLADDHVMFRQGMKRILEGMADLNVVGEVGDGLELLARLTKSTPDMVILDISMPNLRGIEATKEIKRAMIWPMLPKSLFAWSKTFFDPHIAGTPGE